MISPFNLHEKLAGVYLQYDSKVLDTLVTAANVELVVAAELVLGATTSERLSIEYMRAVEKLEAWAIRHIAETC